MQLYLVNSLQKAARLYLRKWCDPWTSCLDDKIGGNFVYTFNNVKLYETNNLQLQLICWLKIYTVSQKNVPPLPWYNFDAHKWIRIFFGRNVTDKVGNQKTLYYATSNNLCFCNTWQNAETRKNHILHSIGLYCTHNAPVCYLPERKKLPSVMCLIASNICWGSKISH